TKWLCLAFAFTLAVTSALAISVDVKKKPGDSDWVPTSTTVLEDVFDYTATQTPTARDIYGGNPGNPGKATGFFRVEPSGSRDFRLRDPLGNEFFSIGVSAVNPGKGPNALKAAAERYNSDRSAWARETAALLHTNYFNTLGAWSDFASFKASSDTRFPYCTQLSLMASYGKEKKITTVRPGHAGFPDDCIPVFDPEFAAFCEQRTAELLKDTKDDPWLLGHFSDNELPFSGTALDRFFRQEAGSPGRLAAEKWAAERKLQPDADGKFDASSNRAFLGFVAETYYRIVSEAIRKADPNHLYLGSRLYSNNRSQREVLAACGKYADVVSFNFYGQWTPDSGIMTDWVKWSGRPFMITEFYAKAMDSGLQNLSGAGWVVRRQLDRGYFYQNFTIGLLRQPGCVGFHWFRYQDNDPDDTAVDPSNRDANKGIVGIDYSPYGPLLDRMLSLNDNVYKLLSFYRGR
ncbi:MAG: hypothetical protein AB7F32_08405, partial [Victivallaceae bacterium]